MSRFFARAHLPNISSSKAFFKNFLPLIGLLGNLHCSEPVQTPPNPYAFLREISLPEATRFVPYRPNGFNSDILVAENQLLVYFVPEATSDQRRAVTDYLASHNVRKTGQNSLSNMVQFQVPSMSLLAEVSSVLNSMPGVVIAAPNFAVSGSLDPNPNPILNNVYDGHWWINEIRAREAWDITTGPASIAIVDTGVDLASGHFDRPILRFTRCTRPDGSADFSLYAYSNPFSCAQYFPNLHGTSVAALATASGSDNFGGVGMVWQGQIISVDVYGYRPLVDNCNSPILPFNSLDAGIQVALNSGVRVVNVSQGMHDFLDSSCHHISGSEQAARHLFRSSLVNSIRSAYEHNALVVFSAGNDGFKNDDSWLPQERSSFSRYFRSNVLLVGASDETHNAVCNQDYLDPLCGSFVGSILFNSRCICSSCERPDTLKPYTAEGRVVELFAPGYRIALSRLDRSVGILSDSNGTSLAAPLVSGTAALMWSVNSSIRAESVKQILLDTARSPTSLGGCRPLGRGILDAAAAVRRAREIVSPSLDAGTSADASVDVQTDSTSDSSEVITGTSVSTGRSYGSGSFNRIRRFGSSIIASGISSPSNIVGTFYNRIRFARYNAATGNLFWSRIIQYPEFELIDNSTNLLDISATSDGYVLACSFGQPSARLYLIKIDFDGQVVWSRDLSRSAIGRATQVSKLFSLPDGSILLVSRSNLFGDAGSGENSVLTSFDSNGNIRFSRSFIRPAYSHLGRYPILDSALFSNRVFVFYSRDAVSLDLSGDSPGISSYDYFGGLRVISGSDFLRGFTLDESLPDGGIVGGNVLFDSTGAIISRTPISLINLNFVNFSDVQPISDGFLISGSGSDSEELGSARGLLVRLNSSGRILWQRLYGDVGSHFYSATQTDSGFVAVGFIPDSSLGSSWIVRVDGFGNPIR